MKSTYITSFVVALTAAFLSGCCSYSELKRDVGSAKVEGRTPIASYEVVNITYKLLGLIPLTTGETWKEGPYNDDVGSMSFFCDQASLDDNMASVRHACQIVGSDEIVGVTGRIDTYWAWSCLLCMKQVYKTSCVIVK